MATNDLKPITREDCHAYLDDTIFRLRPAEYKAKYPNWPGAVGLENEMLPIFWPKSSGELPRLVPLQGKGDTIAEVLTSLAAAHKWVAKETLGNNGESILLAVELDDQDNLSFEPGGQLEFSSKPYPCLSDAVRRMRDIQKILGDALSQRGIDLVQIGINPWYTIDEVGLQMQKGRYLAMDRYYASIGDYGRRMMRQTCTIQVNLDFGADEATLAKRYMAGLLLAPLAAATFSYSAVVDRQNAGARGFRSRVWRYTDPTHTGLPGLERCGEALTRKDCIESYLDFALKANIVFVTALNYKVLDKPMSFGQWLEQPIEGISPTLEDFQVHLSLLFPEVRPRGFLELRSIDCQPRAFQVVPACWYTGLLYNQDVLDRLMELLLPRRYEMKELLYRADTGLRQRDMRELAQSVMQLAAEGFDGLPSCFKSEGSERILQVFKDEFTDRGRTPADDILETIAREGKSYISYTGLKALEEHWASRIGL